MSHYTGDIVNQDAAAADGEDDGGGDGNGS